MPAKLDIWNRRMFLLMDHCIDTGVCDSKKEFLESVGASISNLSKIRNGTTSFTIDHMVSACKKYKVSMNWITGLDSQMKLEKSKTPLARLKDSVREMEAFL